MRPPSQLGGLQPLSSFMSLGILMFQTMKTIRIRVRCRKLIAASVLMPDVGMQSLIRPLAVGVATLLAMLVSARPALAELPIPKQPAWTPVRDEVYLQEI